MELSDILSLLEKVRGCTFASIDSETFPSVGIRKVSTGENVLLFNSRVSGYERMVRRRLEALGKNPNDFVLSDLPWGERKDDLPGCLIWHPYKSVFYLQVVVIRPGTIEVFVGDNRVPPDEVSFILPSKGNNQGLPDDRAVIVRTYALPSLTAVRLMGEEVRADGDVGKHLPIRTDRVKKPTLRVPGLRRD